MQNIIRNKSGKIIEIEGFKIKHHIVFDRSLGGYSDCMFKIKEYFEHNNEILVDLYDSIIPSKSLFTKGFRKPTEQEIIDFKN